ncbi:hypothetical protein [Deinococcus aestuarii]|uniref:hypothetical protein n=1 Tax=Deinococcus aestuarii TaxID=2774531 RepID=UPI001C0C9F92|nr:hypothetical protein [Deinococcus aestuarii]
MTPGRVTLEDLERAGLPVHPGCHLLAAELTPAQVRAAARAFEAADQAASADPGAFSAWRVVWLEEREAFVIYLGRGQFAQDRDALAALLRAALVWCDPETGELAPLREGEP